MKSYTETQVRDSISEVMDQPAAGEFALITRWERTSNMLISVADFNAMQKLDAEFADIMQHYGKSIERLTHR
ncbi:hypothetical protein DET57_11919 [Klebsiella oxytoca]|jgi:hypothetical protein|uniref:Antitoxin n=1 Tax=Klebsiella oxytoca TaxID=571 RepID=A0A318FH26_KLEOX|nr:type II toxin-antitoxin system prevent-host-death family antitoxin [Klebsiella oxytoca]PXW39535.1 hypothetical protein DET57_11919 [Klebsiella oxytoca]